MDCMSIADHRQTFFPVTFSEAGRINKPTPREFFFLLFQILSIWNCQNANFGAQLKERIQDSGCQKMQVASGGLLRNSHEFRYDLYAVRSYCPFFRYEFGTLIEANQRK